MKVWLLAVAVQLSALPLCADNYRVVASPSLQLEVWIDDVTDARAQSWCTAVLPLRIVAAGDAQPAALEDFLPKVGSLLTSQCGALNRIDWRMENRDGHLLAQGTVLRTGNWSLPLPAAPQPVATAAAEPADTTPWLQFSLLEGCHFRGYWGQSGSASALFIAATQGGSCAEGGWLTGRSMISETREGTTRTHDVTFLQGFPLLGKPRQAAERTLQITTVNNQRMVLSDAEAPDSWLILPYDEQQNGWRTDGVVAVQLTQQQGGDESLLSARLAAARAVWSPWLTGRIVTLALVDELQLQLKNPAAAAWRTIEQEIM